MGKRELVALLILSSWCLVTVERLFLAVPRGCLRFVIVVFPDHTHLLFFMFLQCLFIYTSRCWEVFLIGQIFIYWGGLEADQNVSVKLGMKLAIGSLNTLLWEEINILLYHWLCFFGTKMVYAPALPVSPLCLAIFVPAYADHMT